MLLVFSHVQEALVVTFGKPGNKKIKYNVEILREGSGWVDKDLDFKVLVVRV